MNWQPIETAPKDGSIILLRDDNIKPVEHSFHVGFWGKDWKDEFDWCISCYGIGIATPSWIDEYEPATVCATHWMPLDRLIA